MSIFSQFSTNKEKEIEGVPVKYAPNADGTVPTFYVSRMGKANKKYEQYLTKVTKPHARQLRMNTMDPATADALFLDVFVKTIIKGWENVQDADGHPIPFTTESATALFKALPDLYDDLSEQAQSAALFRDEENEADAGNSQKS